MIERPTFLTGDAILQELTPEKFREMALIYMAAFGQTLPREGAVKPDGDAKTLSSYFRECVFDSASFKASLAKPDRLRQIVSGGRLGSRELIYLLEWLEDSPEVEEQVRQTTGYTRYYTLTGVVERLRTDLTPKIAVEPVIFLWGNPLNGFATLYIVDSEAALTDKIKDIPYQHPDAADQIIKFLKENEFLAFRFEWDSEAAAVDTARGGSASGWKQGLYKARLHSQQRECRYAAVITFEESQVYKGLMRQKSTQKPVLKISSPTGEMMLVVTDVAGSVIELGALKLNVPDEWKRTINDKL